MNNNILWIQKGRVIDPFLQIDIRGDIFVRNGIIVDNLSKNERECAQKIFAKEYIVCPGLVDLHVHFREPGEQYKETIKTGSFAAAKGGFTTVVCMPNTNPPCDNPETIQYINKIIAEDSIINIYTTGCITLKREGRHLSPIGSLKKAGIVALTDDGNCIQSNEVMRNAVEYANMFNLTIMDHCQDYAMTRNAVMNESQLSFQLGLQGWPASAEEIIVARNIILSKHLKIHIHVQHISSAYSVDMIRKAKADGIAITAEVSPHHINLTEEKLYKYNTNFKMNPPLRTNIDRESLIKGLLDGSIDIIATDHAPHENVEKNCEFNNAPFGVIGLETSLSICLETLYHSGLCSLPFLIEKMTYKPANLLNLECGTLQVGKPADITIFDPHEIWTVKKNEILSKSQNSPWINKSLRGKVKFTIVNGLIVYSDQGN